MIIIDEYFEKKNCMNKKSDIILITIKFIEKSCIHHSCLHSIFISLFVLIFLINNYYKNIVIFETVVVENRTVA